MSFGFVATDESWSGNTRELRSVELHEISVVQSWPAYSQTEVSLRNRPHQQGFVDLDNLPASIDPADGASILRRLWVETV